jgi:hypothetical protein
MGLFAADRDAFQKRRGLEHFHSNFAHPTVGWAKFYANFQGIVNRLDFGRASLKTRSKPAGCYTLTGRV